ncbi:DUF2243 domain-containing protein [Dietzia psychralcaliphila]|uniref:DUF2243 domain-containing protein n=1 Tax=Dietzia psychralcaliphila TaxID=139021 RepID=A0AAD0JRZ0_9ACTN|nr:DUF2243 domain-containing protein [Dietzia psychralcaliphila]AWH96888.1 hypothetical protein A6048_16860 [Dietzia psychralcaliphila]PTM89547.1 putative membrane protein [Dietzia psychralcaliphila]
MPPPTSEAHAADPTVNRRLVLSGFLFGCGIAGSVIDLFVFHLLLQWHHFYDLSTTNIALLTDGLFHGATWLITVWGLFMLGDVRHRVVVPWWRWSGAVLAGVGFFQLFDGLVFHKLLRIHQIRYGVDLVVYDLAWLGSAALLLLVGALILWRTSGVHLRAPASGQPRD